MDLLDLYSLRAVRDRGQERYPAGRYLLLHLADFRSVQPYRFALYRGSIPEPFHEANDHARMDTCPRRYVPYAARCLVDPLVLECVANRNHSRNRPRWKGR